MLALVVAVASAMIAILRDSRPSDRGRIRILGLTRVNSVLMLLCLFALLVGVGRTLAEHRETIEEEKAQRSRLIGLQDDLSEANRQLTESAQEIAELRSEIGRLRGQSQWQLEYERICQVVLQAILEAKRPNLLVISGLSPPIGYVQPPEHVTPEHEALWQRLRRGDILAEVWEDSLERLRTHGADLAAAETSIFEARHSLVPLTTEKTADFLKPPGAELTEEEMGKVMFGIVTGRPTDIVKTESEWLTQLDRFAEHVKGIFDAAARKMPRSG